MKAGQSMLNCKAALLVIPIGLMLWLGCSSDDSANQDEINETYVGELRMDVAPDTVGRNTIDTLRLKINGSRFTVTMLTNRANICNIGGTVKDFGTNSALFRPTDSMPSFCDSIHVLRGRFPTVFKGDSLTMTKFDSVLNTQFGFYLKR